MSTTCPNGHHTATTDYCDQCGALLTALPTPAVVGPEPSSYPSTKAHPTDVEVPLDTTPSVPSQPCPDCGAPRVGSDKFCEGCGYNFATGKSSGDPAPSPASPIAPLAPRDRGSSASTIAPPAPRDGGSPTTGLWEALVSADRAYFERVAAEEIDFPSHYPVRRFPLGQAQITIGRGSPSRGIHPEIDLSGAPEDPAISRVHAILARQDDGSYALIDPGSVNGTALNDDPTPIAPNTPVPLADGDRIHLGAFTTITIRPTTTSPATEA
jgi:hypothetical protein